jgi:hypothetical protein
MKVPNFRPYVFIVTSLRMPTSIAMAAVAGGGMKTITLPNATTVDDLGRVQVIVIDHFRSNEGNCILFDRIVAFLFVYAPNEGIMMDTAGNVVETKTGQFWPISISIQDQIASYDRT